MDIIEKLLWFQPHQVTAAGCKQVWKHFKFKMHTRVKKKKAARMCIGLILKGVKHTGCGWMLHGFLSRARTWSAWDRQSSCRCLQPHGVKSGERAHDQQTTDLGERTEGRRASRTERLQPVRVEAKVSEGTLEQYCKPDPPHPQC